jgi:glycosyltransferase involved in cell wall biosynthesis
LSMQEPVHIFISHPSHFMTDCEPHGDGLLAFQYIYRLAQRGYELHVAVPLMSLQHELPPNVHLYPIHTFAKPSRENPSALSRLEYAVRVRRLLSKLMKQFPIQLVHQLNPVVPGMSLFLPGAGLPILLGPLPAPGTAELPRSIGTTLKLWVLHKQVKSAVRVMIPNIASYVLLPKDEATKAKVRILPYGIDAKIFRPMPELAPSQPVILYLANLVRRKGAPLLIEAFELIADKYPAAVLHIAGKGPDEAEVYARAASSPVRDRIHFLGNIAREDVPELINSCTLYCLPSSSEPFGMTILEAMSCGKPVIGTTVGGLGVLLDQEGALRFTAGRADELASALDQLLSSVELREKMGVINRRIALETYSWDAVTDTLEAIYREVLVTKP